MRKVPDINVVVKNRHRKSFEDFVQNVITDTFTYSFQPTDIRLDAETGTFFTLILGSVDNSDPADGDYVDVGDIKGYRFIYEDLPVSSAKDYIDVFLFGIRQEKEGYYLELYDANGTLLGTTESASDCREIRIIFTTDITRVPGEVLKSDFDIRGKIMEIN